jgi:2-isopropylmalate synthase
VAALARCASRDIEAAARALEPAAWPVIHIVLGASDIHLEKKLGMTRAEALRCIERSVAHARRLCGDVEFSVEDATRSERMFLRQCVLMAVDAGATRVNIADTVGCALPHEFGAMIGDVVSVADHRAVVSAHCHNDLGLATANTLAAVMHGARQVEVTVNGIGERAGNTALEEVAVALALKGVGRTGVTLQSMTSLSRAASEATGVPVQPNRAIVGANAFAHSSGIHQDGILKDASNYEFVPPGLVGAPGHRLVLTARSGRRALAHCAARLGFAVEGAALDDLYEAFTRRADVADGAFDDEDFAAFLQETMGAVR